MKNTKRNTRLITFTDPHSPITEAFRTLRTNIQFAGVDKQVKTMLITGATPNCGKSTTTANLGVALAQAGSQVLVVDTDLRKPSIHRYFSLDNEPGLTNLLFDVTMDLNMVVNKSRIKPVCPGQRAGAAEPGGTAFHREDEKYDRGAGRQLRLRAL